MLADLIYAWRQLRKSPGFAVTVVLTLAIGIGANSAMFSLMDAIVLRPLAVPDLNRVMTLDEEQGRGNYKQVSLANYEDWKAQSRSFEDMAVYRLSEMSLADGGGATRVVAASTSANFFTVLRAGPLMGRPYDAGQAQEGKDEVALLNYGFWQRRFGGDAGVLGRKIELNGRSYSVAGVMPKAVQYPSTADVFLPLAPMAEELHDRKDHNYLVLGRLRPGVSPKQAQAEMAGISDRLAAAYPATNQGWSVHVEELLEGINGDYTNLYMRMLTYATLFVLLVVCANIANLQFARGIARRPEIAMRTALGAGRGRLLRQLLMENILLGLMGGTGGIAIAELDLKANLGAMPARVARYMAGWSNISLNGRVLAYSLLLALAAGLAAGLMPALEALRVNLTDQLKAGSRTTSGSRRTHRLRHVFATAQIALAVALVIGAALMTKGTQSIRHGGDRYDPNHVMTFQVHLPAERYGTPDKQAEWYDESIAKLRALPGVKQVSVSNTLPWGDYGWMDDFRIENRVVVPGKFQSAVHLMVSPGYFDSMRIPIVAGRGFSTGDGRTTLPVAVVSTAFAKRYFANENPIGHRIRMGAASGRDDPWVTIVGLSGELAYEWGDRVPNPAVALDEEQFPPVGARFVVVTDGNPLALASAAQKTLASIDPAVPLDAMQTYQQMMSESFVGLFYAETMLGVDAGIALLLAAIGIFGVMANLVAERMREIGLRLAVGAQREDVLRMILRKAGVLAGWGLGIGLVLAAGLARLVSNLLVGVRPNDPVVFGGISLAILTVALIASWVPARHAAGVDPMEALRDE
ncbi:MAG TPA: ABC transporter permease [Acidobacteriaceae bacterium]|jgi:putative ABC transport system permease protein|nr:ABC transporter permease [Acidobacteriaceae bacterium]